MIGRETDFADETLAAFGIGTKRPDNDRSQRTFSDPVTFIESSFYIPERQHLDPPSMLLEPYQRAVLREAYRRDPETGKFAYDVVVWSDIKKSIKSCIAAAVILHRALETSWGMFRVVANDLNQANSRVFYYIQRALTLNRALGRRVRTRNYKITLDNHSFIEAIPVDPKGEAGGNDDLIEWTELHAADSRAARLMWTEMTLSPTKHGYSQRWIDTYAGHTGEAPILEMLYEAGVKQGRRLTLPDAPDDLEVYANDRMLVLWNTVPRMSWQSADYYSSEARTLTPSEFARIHRNEWVSSTSVFVPLEWWDACAAEQPALDNRTPMVVGIDAAVTSDCFAIVGVTRDGEQVRVRYVNVWSPPPGGRIDFSQPEAELRRLAREYNVAEFAYDPMQMEDMAMRLRRDGVGHFRPFPQASDRLIADKHLYDLIRDRGISHGGDALLREHVGNANRKDEGDKLRIIKRAEHLHIDAAVALSMSAYRAKRLNIG